MATTNVPAITWTPNGPIIPQESEVLSGAQADINAAFGGDVNPELETPQGQLASSATAIIGDKNSQIAMLPNQVNPDFADGIWQDAIGRIYFLDRKPAAPTTVQCTCVGLSGKTIPAGAKAVDTSGNIYLCVGGGVIPVGGSISLSFACAENGPIPCPAGTLTAIYQSVPGWDTITNPADGVLGRVVESRADFEARRRASVALNAHGTPAAIYANVFNVEDVIDCYVIDNPQSTAVAVGSTAYAVAPHSVYVAVSGGDDFSIAQAIWEKKDLGCDTNGNTVITVTDDTYSEPKPQYSFKFNRPASLPIKFAVNLVNKASLPSDIIEQVKSAIISAFGGADGGDRARIGGPIYASRYYSPVAVLSPSVAIISILIGTTSASGNSIEVGIDQIPTISASNISVTLT